MTHPQLVDLAAKWLARRCSVVVTELVTTGETPDVLGWQGTYSTLIECKASRADFAADRHKPFRRDEWQGVGQERYFFAVHGVIDINSLPPNWGLIEVTPRGIRVARKSGCVSGSFEANARHEIGILLSTLRRLAHTKPYGVSVKCYTIESKNTATCGIELPSEPEPCYYL